MYRFTVDVTRIYDRRCLAEVYTHYFLHPNRIRHTGRIQLFQCTIGFPETCPDRVVGNLCLELCGKLLLLHTPLAIIAVINQETVSLTGCGKNISNISKSPQHSALGKCETGGRRVNGFYLLCIIKKNTVKKISVLPVSTTQSCENVFVSIQE